MTVRMRGTITAMLFAALMVGGSRTARAQHSRRHAPSPAAPALEPPQVVEARRHFEQGRALFDSGNHDAAIAEFQRAYDLLAGRSGQYVMLFNLAQCHERLFRYELALQFYRRFLAEGGPDARDRAAVEATIATLEGLLATVHVRSNVERAEAWVDDRLVGAAPGDLRIPGGRHVVELRAPGFLPTRREVQIPARGVIDLELAMEVVRSRRGVSPVFFWTALGLGAATAVAGGIFGVQALVARNDVDARLADPSQRFTVSEDDQRAIARSVTTADVLYGTAAAFGATAFVLAFLTEWRAPSEGPPRATAYVGFGSAGVVGSF